MKEQQRILVPQVSTFPNHEARARLMLRWLVQRNIVEEQLSTCGRTGSCMGYAIAPGAKRVALHPERLPF